MGRGYRRRKLTEPANTISNVSGAIFFGFILFIMIGLIF